MSEDMNRLTMSSFWVLLLLLLCAVISSDASSENVLVLFDDPLIRHTHSLYFGDLTSRGYSLTFRAAGDKKLQLRNWDEWMYDKLIIFAPTAADFGGAVDAASILEFIDAGRDVVIAVDSRVSDEMRSLVAEVGVDVEPRGSALVDHADFVKTSAGGHNVVASSRLVNSSAILGNYPTEAPVLFKGVASTISPDSMTATAVLSGPDTAFSHAIGKPVTEAPAVAHGNAVLVAAVQARNGARVLVSGSLDMFSNAFFAMSVETSLGTRSAPSGNQAFCSEVTKWAFHERGVLRVTNLHHNRVGSEEEPGWYRVMDDLEFGLDIHELSEGEWKPYRATDVQVEFVMLDPYVRKTLHHHNKGRYFTSFKVPDVYGVYKFMVTYHRTGYTALDLTRTVSVRPFRHNEFERFLVAAYPYYASVFSTMAAFFLFGFVFLYHK